MNIREKISSYLAIRNLSKPSLILNIISIVFGIIYILLGNLGIDYVFIIWDIFGVILLITLFLTLFLIFLNISEIDRDTKMGKKFSKICYLYLILMIIAMLLIYRGNVIYQSTYATDFRSNIRSFNFIYGGYFFILIFGACISFYDLKNLERNELWISEIKQPIEKSWLCQIIIRFLKLGCYLSLLMGIYFAYAIIFGYYFEMVAGAVGMMVPEYAIYLAFFFLSITIFLLGLERDKAYQRYYKVIMIIGVIITGIHLLPLFSTPFTIYGADTSFTETFGNEWKDDLDQNVNEEYFMKSPFWIAGYFLGIPAKDCNYQNDVLYLDGASSSEEVDKDISLYFDVYWPEEIKEEMPGVKNGKSSVIIFIHGGAWKYGDKAGSKIIMCKYFASQGYVVYDIQYGLKDVAFEAMPTPDYLKGDFDINDMVRHIGIFTHYISEDSNEYSAENLDANLESVFVSGGSAGGHLTLATALGIESGLYNDLFGSRMKIEGIIPFYPGPPSLAGDKELINPEEYLIDNESPPCLIYQGTQDYVCAEVSLNVKEGYDTANNDDCCIIWLPFSGHANDIHRTAYFNQIFTYYMERFIFLCVEGEIS